MNRKHYFGAGPAALPQSVLKEFSEAVLDYQQSGISILSIAHRGPAFKAILEEANALVFQLAGLSSDEYEVMWFQGGGRLQFSMVPMNFLSEGKHAGYIDSGHWAHAALEAASLQGSVDVLASSAKEDYTRIPDWPVIGNDLSYLHVTTNNTIFGTQMPEIPACPVPLIADMSSDIFSMPRNYSNCDLIYAVAQKNLGAAGVTIVIAKKKFLESANKNLPPVLSYIAQAKAGSMLNTPPVAAIYSCLLMLRWTASRGLSIIETENKQKAELLYSGIDRSPLFISSVEKESRSRMNVVFRMKDPSQETAFLEYCSGKNIEGIKGHRSVGGFRVSLYNAVSLEDAAALLIAMQQFEQIEN
jgi:phosphoserine aminotransferase